MTRIQTRCDQCGQYDDHPKVHISLRTLHHDCLAADDRNMLVESNVSNGSDLGAIINAAVDGTHGDDLLAVIGKAHDRAAKKASAIKATSYANDVLDQTFNNGSSGTDVIGSTTYTLPYRVAFLNTVETAGTPGTEWTTAAGYTAGGVSIAGLFTTAAASAAKANTGAVSVANAPAGTWADNRLQDSTGTPKRLVAKGTPSLAKTINLGDTCTIGIGALSGTEV